MDHDVYSFAPSFNTLLDIHIKHLLNFPTFKVKTENEDVVIEIEPEKMASTSSSPTFSGQDRMKDCRWYLPSLEGYN